MKMNNVVGAALVAIVALCAGAPVAHADYIDHFAEPNDIGILKVPRAGTTHVLVIPIIVDDQPFDQGTEAAFLEEIAAFYDPAATGWAFTPYYEAASVGRFRPEATLAAAVHFPTCPPLGDYEDCAIPRGAGFSEGDLAGALQVVDDALTFIDDIITCATAGPGGQRTCTTGGGAVMANFDTSGIEVGTPDGIADGVILISNAAFPGIALPIKDLSTNPLLSFVGPFPSFVYDGVTVGAVAIGGSASLPKHTSWVTVHEFGHLLGWADLYNEAGTATDMPYSLMGGWSYDAPGSLPDALSRMAAGFAHVVQISSSTTIQLQPADLAGTVLKVGTGDEFFVIELRRTVPDTLDGDLERDFGVVVTRVRLEKRPSPQARQYLNTLQNCVNCDPFDAFLSIEQADGRFDLESARSRDDANDLFLDGDEIAPSEDTEPRTSAHRVFSTNLSDGTATGIRIRVVEASRESAVVEIETPEVANACSEIEEFCGGLPCEAGECGRVVDPLGTDLPIGEECAGGCCCEATAVNPATLLAAALVLFLRPRRSILQRAKNSA